MSTAETIANRFIAYLKEEDQYASLPEITKQLQNEVWRNQDIYVISALELSAAEQKETTAELLKKWGEHQVVFTVDPTLLSGLIVRFQDNVIDLSGLRNLNDLKETLTTQHE